MARRKGGAGGEEHVDRWSEVHSLPLPLLSQARRTLSAMAELFALEALHSDPTLRNEDYVAPPRAKAMEREVRGLCAELR